MSSNIEMVYSDCVSWLQDWIDADQPVIEDIWDAEMWMTYEMTDAINMFIQNAFHSLGARNDALTILRALCYEYYLLRSAAARSKVPAAPTAPQRLKNAPQSAQKSAAWHAESYDMLSGHEFGAIVSGGPAEYQSIVLKKINPPPPSTDQNIVFLTPPEGLSPFKWGWRFEQVARDLYEMEFAHGVVYDGLGRLRHPSLPRLGASPDGIITTGPKIGRLVELKCPISRVINGNIPHNYWAQMQLQAEVCDVPAVEYFEVSLGSIIQTAPQMDTYMNSAKDAKLRWIGKVCVVADHEDDASNLYRYVYSPLFINSDTGINECMSWQPSSGVILESTLWWVKDFNTLTVLRNKRWWEIEGLPAYNAFWERVSAARLSPPARIARPLFVDDTDLEENGHVSHESDSTAGYAASDTESNSDASAVEGWQGAESDREKDTAGTALFDND